jgi:hypothetical protein
MKEEDMIQFKPDRWETGTVTSNGQIYLTEGRDLIDQKLHLAVIIDETDDETDDMKTMMDSEPDIFRTTTVNAGGQVYIGRCHADKKVHAAVMYDDPDTVYDEILGEDN